MGDSNTWGYDAETNGRFPDDVRWTGRLSERLGDSYTVIEEGLSGRTTVFEDPLNEGMSALPYLYPCLMSHAPLDYMVVMLGTNDCKEYCRWNEAPCSESKGGSMLERRREDSHCGSGADRHSLRAVTGSR